ncbi:metal ABC transporter solute-binding protein, Zn/Mn family [Metabacillus endolithicus]|uniref:metal ABC transporter solute-binding protein, Zn/Mn family n=1 Tax=Metabacillus endolithicus TaxID=1535204 RepID=UPI001FF92E57|nr:zinc ABC transporter substrate-binding protein [Metabacillus endolithicus]UPG64911.1 zinc ABC transporter substrate-binding protein [Metabacillus endolithicus]
MSSFLLLSSLLIGCNASNEEGQSANETNTEDTLKIYTTIYPLEDFAKKIGGDLVEVENILPPGVDAHTYEPTTKAMVEIAEADGFIYSGVGFESFTEKVQESLNSEDVAFINAGEGIEYIEGHEEEAAHDETEHAEEEAAHDESAHAEDEAAHDESEHTEDEAAHDENAHAEDEAAHDENAHAEDEAAHDESAHTEDEAAHDENAHAEDEAAHDESAHAHDHGDQDPHVWIDPIHSITLAENIKDALIELNPEGKQTFEDNFQALKTQLEDLDQSFKDVISNAEKKEILVSHAAYGYWENRYGIEQISVLELSPTEEPSQKELQTIIETAKEHEINYIIFETNVTSNVTDIVQAEIGAEALTLSNLESITEEDVKNNEDYFSIMERNLETLKTALSSK